MPKSEWLKLAGIGIIMIGFALRLRTTLVVLVAALVTGWLAGLPLLGNAGGQPGTPGTLDLLGKAFADNRLMTLFILTLPAIGLAERHGLQAQSALLIRRVRIATVGRLQVVYQLFRILHGALGIRLNGHPAFVRPLVFPMSLGAAQGDRAAPLPEQVVERIKAANAAAENYGNFYGQNLAVVQAGILLVYGVMKGLGYEVSLWRLVGFTLPIVVASILLGMIQFYWFERSLRKQLNETEAGQ